MNLFELRQQHKAALDKAETLLGASDHVMTTAETEQYNTAMAEANNIGATIKAREQMSTIRAAFPKGQPIVETGRNVRSSLVRSAAAWQTREYADAFEQWAAARGRHVSPELAAGGDELGGFKFAGIPSQPRVSAASYEGSSTEGAAIVPVVIQQQIVPLSPPEMGISKLATVIPTETDLRFPRKTAHGTAAAKAEGTGNGSNLFTGTDPTLDQFTLSAFMIGHPEDASWELLQDVNVFQSFLTEDILLSLAVLKEGWFWSGSGTNQAQGIKGNIGAGVSANQVITAGSGDSNGSALIDATFDVMGALNAVYHPRAAFLMSRATSVYIRKAQKQSNLFEPVYVRVGAQDYLHGYPVEFSTSVDDVSAVNHVPVVFGDFKAGYLIGVRGGAGINVKILDQPKALEGLLTVLGYQRLDGRVRRSEALQPVTIAS